MIFETITSYDPKIVQWYLTAEVYKKKEKKKNPTKIVDHVMTCADGVSGNKNIPSTDRFRPWWYVPVITTRGDSRTPAARYRFENNIYWSVANSGYSYL